MVARAAVIRSEVAWPTIRLEQTSLITHAKGLPFGELKQLCGLTDGNLNRHLMVLEEAKLVVTTKGLERGRPQTVCRITPLGRRRYIEYLAVLEQVVLDASSAIRADTPARGGHNPANA